MAKSIYFRIVLLVMVAILSVLSMSYGRAAESLAEVRQKFVGDWELVSFMRFPDGGGEIEVDYVGRLRYDEAGYMMGLGMPSDLPLQAEGATERVTGG
ncbi:MAG: lipocalin-like domain-containing protein, partial [Gammaproteobacteria bacterium]|nr:lipocalin-like domain-containing protein [Gammaproteobacteria bacterium]